MSGAYLEFAREHAPLLMIATPLIGAALMLISGPARISWLIACAAAVIGAVISVDFAVVLLTRATQPIAEVGVALFVDGIGAFAAALLSITLALVVFAVGTTLKESGGAPAPLSLALLLTMGAGWIGALMARDLVAVFASVETAWLAAVGLTAVNAVRERGPLNGAFRMLIMGGVGSALMLLGIGMLGRATGGLEIDGLPLAHIRMSNLAGAGAALVVLGFVVKAGVAPLHAWSAAAIGRAGPMIALGVGTLGVLGALSALTRFAAYAIIAPEIGAAMSAGLSAAIATW